MPTCCAASAPPGDRSDLPEFTPPGPPLDLAQWRLVADGEVDRPLALTWDDIQNMPPVAHTDDFRCLGGWVVPDNHWRGVSLAAVLGRAGLRAGACYILVTAGDCTHLGKGAAHERLHGPRLGADRFFRTGAAGPSHLALRLRIT